MKITREDVKAFGSVVVGWLALMLLTYAMCGCASAPARRGRTPTFHLRATAAADKMLVAFSARVTAEGCATEWEWQYGDGRSVGQTWGCGQRSVATLHRYRAQGGYLARFRMVVDGVLHEASMPIVVGRRSEQ